MAPVLELPRTAKHSASEMVNRCFRHQHPEAYGRPAAPEAAVPPQLRYGAGEVYATSPALAEEQMGDPEAVPLV